MRTKSMLAALAVVILGLALAACGKGGSGGGELKQLAQQRVGDYVVTLLSESGQLKQGPNKYVMEFHKAADNQLVDVGEVKLIPCERCMKIALLLVETQRRLR